MPFGRPLLILPDLLGPAAFAAETASRPATMAMTIRFIDLSLPDCAQGTWRCRIAARFTRPAWISAREPLALAYGRCRISAYACRRYGDLG